jgi:hypothetical protein
MSSLNCTSAGGITMNDIKLSSSGISDKDILSSSTVLLAYLKTGYKLSLKLQRCLCSLGISLVSCLKKTGKVKPKIH